MLAGLQAFTPPATSLYAAVWVQWVLIYLTDADLVGFLARCARSLLPGGRIVVKESVARDGFYADESDASITRTDGHFRALYAEAGLEVEASEAQPHWPKAVFPVRMYALRVSS